MGALKREFAFDGIVLLVKSAAGDDDARRGGRGRRIGIHIEGVGQAFMEKNARQRVLAAWSIAGTSLTRFAGCEYHLFSPTRPLNWGYDYSQKMLPTTPIFFPFTDLPNRAAGRHGAPA